MNEVEKPDKPKLNLYVVGESSGDPDQWSPWGGRAIVVASCPEEAVSLSERAGPVVLLDLSAPCVVMNEQYSE